MAYLRALAGELQALRTSDSVGIQLVNLSPALRNAEAYAAFGSSVGVMEFPMDFWEQAGGAAVGGL